VSVFEKNTLQGGHLDVYRGSENRTGWNNTMGSFMVISHQTTKGYWETFMRCDDATNMYGRERYRNFDKRYKKNYFIRKIYSQTEEQKHSLQQKSGVDVDWTHLS
jgi:hypothetical protein